MLYEYDNAGKLLTRVKLQARTDASGWDYVEKTELEYDGNSNCINISVYNGYDYDTEEWTYLRNTLDFTYDPTVSINNIAGLSMFWKEWFYDFNLDIPLFNKLQHITMNDSSYQYDFYYSNYNGLDDPTENHLAVWPNPATEVVHIEGLEAAEVQVYNALGQLVKTVRNSNEINVAGLAEGVYLVRITDAKGVSQTERITVIR